MLRFHRTLKRSASCYLTCASCVTGRVRYRRLRRLVASLAVPLESSRIFSMAVAQYTILTASALACMRFRPRTRYLLSGSSVDKTERQVITRFVEREEGYAAGPGPVAYHHRTMTRTLVRSVRRRSAHVLIGGCGRVGDEHTRLHLGSAALLDDVGGAG